MSELFNPNIGQRLSAFRKLLSYNTGKKYTQAMVADELKVKHDIVNRLENGLGSIDNLIKLLVYYHLKGYNILWIIVPDNMGIPQYLPQSTEQARQNPDVIEALERLNYLLLGKPPT